MTRRGRLVLAEAPLETVPRELWGHPSVYKYARKRGKPPRSILLDSSLHHQAMRGLPDRERRGRPDVVHLTLLSVLEAPVVRRGLVEVVVHTYGDYVIEIDPSTRLPRNYQRFTGLIEQLLEHGAAPPTAEKPLITVRPGALESLARGALLLDPGAEEETRLAEAAERLLEGDTVVVAAVPGSTPSPRLRAIASPMAPRGLRGAEPWVMASHLLALAAAEAGII